MPDNFLEINDEIHETRFFPEGYFMQRHKPVVMEKMHTHGHVEVLLPDGCELTYLTQTGTFKTHDQSLHILWGQIPHRVTKVKGDGNINIANLPLHEILSMQFPESFLSKLFTGQLIHAKQKDTMDISLFKKWISDYSSKNIQKISISKLELRCRLTRQMIDEWNYNEKHYSKPNKQTSKLQLMIKFLAENYSEPLNVKSVASAGGVSEGYAMSLFQKKLNKNITSYLNQLRLHHAKSALIDGNDKISNIAHDSGFGSLSRFYEVFLKETGLSPSQYRKSF
ncbi:helix-turn-helix domain-containing protein [Alphaproteobacteria bacterium]|jgi:AraC-like DNA-binding protein|nr:helix-turn-helix domain-containing protein [Alphaproteobacteria bacterium]